MNIWNWGDFTNTTIFSQQRLPAAIGTTLAGLHRATFQGREYRDFMSTAPQGQFRYNFYNPAQGIGSMSPEIFGQIPS